MGDLILAFVAMVLVAWGGFKYGERQQKKAEDERNEELKKRYDDAVESSHAGGAAWRDRLRDSKSLRD